MAYITTTADLRKSGFTAREILRSCLPFGPWQLLLPGVILRKSTPPTRLDKLHAAQAYAGPNSVITGADALSRQGAAVPVPRHIHVLQGKNNRRTHPGILFERTARPPAVVEKDSLRLADPARATVDMARRESDPHAVVAVLDAVLRPGLCTPEALAHELDHGTQRGTALVRQALNALRAARPTPAPPARRGRGGSSRPRARTFEHT